MLTLVGRDEPDVGGMLGKSAAALRGSAKTELQLG